MLIFMRLDPSRLLPIPTEEIELPHAQMVKQETARQVRYKPSASKRTSIVHQSLVPKEYTLVGRSSG